MGRGADFLLWLGVSLAVFWPWRRCGFVYLVGGNSAWAAPEAPAGQRGSLFSSFRPSPQTLFPLSSQFQRPLLGAPGHLPWPGVALASRSSPGELEVSM